MVRIKDALMQMSKKYIVNRYFLLRIRAFTEEDDNMHLLMNSETHFHFHGTVNKQNLYTRNPKNPINIH